eukprot:c5341_g1_i1 orf=321-1796(-)
MAASPSPTVSFPLQLPLKEVPGSYGLPFFGPLMDRLDFFWFQGEKKFWESRMKKYNSTVFRTNVPPSPPGFPTSSVIMLLDQKSFPILFDTSKVEKKDVLLANYMPSTSFYGRVRPCVYLDPSEERHHKLKSFFLDLMKSKAEKWIPEFDKAINEAFPVWETELAKGGKAKFNGESEQLILNVLLRTLLGADPSESGAASLKREGPSLISAWLAPQLAPIASAGLPHLLEEILIHSFPIPYIFVEFSYKKLQKFFSTHAVELLDLAEAQYSLEREDTLHNLIFILGFNAFGGLKLLFTSVMSYVGQAGSGLHDQLVKEVREAVKAEGGITMRACRAMPLVKSTVYEVLRVSATVPYQYAKAKEDFVIESHDACFNVKKGEILGGCQAFASRDPIVFEEPNAFKPHRFMGAEGEKLLQYVIWGNGPGNGKTTADNKQCAGADLVPFLTQLFLVNFFMRYDSFAIEKPVVKGSTSTIFFSSLMKRQHEKAKAL